MTIRDATINALDALAGVCDSWAKAITARVEGRYRSIFSDGYAVGEQMGRLAAEEQHTTEGRERLDELLDGLSTSDDEGIARQVYEARTREPFEATYEATRRMYTGIATATRVAHERRQSGVALLPCGCAPTDPPKDCPYRVDATTFSDRERVWVHGEPLSSRRDGQPTEAA